MGRPGPSLAFDFLTRELGLSAGAAYYRKSAAELIQRFPEVVEPLRDGRLCFTSIVELSKNLTPENRDALLPRFFHVSKREAKAITAELQPVPAPPMRTVITAVPEPRRALVAPPPDAAPFHLDETGPLEVAPRPACPPRERAEVEPLTPDLRRLHLTVSRGLLDALAVARDALSHSHPGASDEAIIKLGLDLIIERHRKRRGIGARPRKAASARDAGTATTTSAAATPPSPPPPKRSHVPAEVWREVWGRDEGKCQWPVEGGGVCGATYQLELDHVEGLALGAGTSVAACRLLCRFHQDVSARRLYGDDLMNRFTQPKRGPRCSEPVAGYGPGASYPHPQWTAGGPAVRRSSTPAPPG